MFKDNLHFAVPEITPEISRYYHYLPACDVTIVLSKEDESPVRVKQINKAVMDIYAKKA